MKIYKRNKPTNMSEYITWASKKLNFNYQREERYYGIISRDMKEQIEESEFWKCLINDLKKVEQEYYLNTNYELTNYEINDTELLRKTYNSFLNKCYRKNIVNNNNWPSEPKGGWVTYQNATERINDIVRTSFIVKYLDGIDFVVRVLNETCDRFNIKPNCKYEAKDEGYYAVHFDIPFIFKLSDINLEPIDLQGNLEIQITTQLKDIIKKLIHNYYKEKRIIIENPESIKWQWNYKSDEFIVNYLGHIIHYLEGTIIEIRDRRK